MINGCHVTLLFGLPGAGKTTALSPLLSSNDALVRLSGGSLIAGEIPEAERDALRKVGSNQILLNQERLLINYRLAAERLESRHIVFDGHCVIKDGSAEVEIPFTVVERLFPDQIIFYDVAPSLIAARRSADFSRPDREVETSEQLEKNRQRQLALCDRYAADLGIPFLITGSAEELSAILA